MGIVSRRWIEVDGLDWRRAADKHGRRLGRSSEEWKNRTTHEPSRDRKGGEINDEEVAEYVVLIERIRPARECGRGLE